jgi:hypothetical protein
LDCVLYYLEGGKNGGDRLLKNVGKNLQVYGCHSPEYHNPDATIIFFFKLLFFFSAVRNKNTFKNCLHLLKVKFCFSQVNITVMTETFGVLEESSSLDSLGIKVEVASAEALQDRDCHLLFGSSQHLSEAANLLKVGCFLLLERIANEDEVQLPNFSLVTKQCAGNTTYLLLRKVYFINCTYNKIVPSHVTKTRRQVPEKDFNK